MLGSRSPILSCDFLSTPGVRQRLALPGFGSALDGLGSGSWVRAAMESADDLAFLGISPALFTLAIYGYATLTHRLSRRRRAHGVAVTVLPCALRPHFLLTGTALDVRR